jgi:hypothetical protein
MRGRYRRVLLYIEHFAYFNTAVFISHHLGPVIPTSAIDPVMKLMRPIQRLIEWWIIEPCPIAWDQMYNNLGRM